MGGVMRGTILWLLMLVAAPGMAATVFKCKNAEGVLQYQEKPCAKETQAVTSWASKYGGAVEDAPGEEGGGPLVISQGQGGHYFVDGTVNDQFLNFVVDTGATVVALPVGIAVAAGIKCEQRVAMNTANGVASACASIISKLTFGRFTLRNVQAVVQPNLTQPLLGMNVLRQFRVEQDEGQMRLSKKY